MKLFLHSTYILMYIKAKVISHAFMIEIYQPGYWYPIKKENLCIKSMESCPLVVSQILAEFRPEKAIYNTFHN